VRLLLVVALAGTASARPEAFLSLMEGLEGGVGLGGSTGRLAELLRVVIDLGRRGSDKVLEVRWSIGAGAGVADALDL
jgi:hypothetical protein